MVETIQQNLEMSAEVVFVFVERLVDFLESGGLADFSSVGGGRVGVSRASLVLEALPLFLAHVIGFVGAVQVRIGLLQFP